MPKARMPQYKIPARKPPNPYRVPKAEKYPTSPPVQPSGLRIMAIDPGITTGIAFRLNGEIITCCAYSDDQVLGMIKPTLDQVIVERFETAGRLSRPGLLTIELVGQIMGWCKSNKIPLEIAHPQSRNSYMQEARASVGTIIERSKVARHQVDALAHLWSWEYRNKPTT